MPTQEQHEWLANTLGVTSLLDKAGDVASAAGTMASGVLQSAEDAGSTALNVAGDLARAAATGASDNATTAWDAGSTVAKVAGDVLTGSFAQAAQDAAAGTATVEGDIVRTTTDMTSASDKIAGDVDSGATTVGNDITQAAKGAAAALLGDQPEDHQEPEAPEHDRADTNTDTLPRPMEPDCKVIRGKVPGPANHVMCSKHGHILDIAAKQIIAADLSDYQQRYGKGKGGGAKPTPTPPQPDPTGPLAPGDVAIVGGKKYVIYPDEIRQGGTVSWVARNPGNIRSGERYGAYKGKKFTTESVGAFAIFPDEATGHAAILKLLKDYGHITVLDTMKKYAPKGDGKNDPVAYAKTVAKRVGATIDTYLDELSAAQLQSFADQIKAVEGWKVGNSFARDDANLPDEIKQRLQ
jgi:hypothetical protein